MRVKKYKFKCQCSDDSPFVREVGRGKRVTFTDPEKLKEYLNESEEAVYMWSDSEDLAVISDMFQVKIKVITTKGASDENPSVNWILPDEDMKEYAETDFREKTLLIGSWYISYFIPSEQRKNNCN